MFGSETWPGPSWNLRYSGVRHTRRPLVLSFYFKLAKTFCCLSKHLIYDRTFCGLCKKMWLLCFTRSQRCLKCDFLDVNTHLQVDISEIFVVKLCLGQNPPATSGFKSSCRKNPFHWCLGIFDFKEHILIVITTILVLSVLSADFSCLPRNLYWLSFQTDCYWGCGNCAIYLMPLHTWRAAFSQTVLSAGLWQRVTRCLIVKIT